MKKVDKQIEEFVHIVNWAKSCETLEQLNTVENFLNIKVKFLTKQKFSVENISRLNYNLGLVEGFIMATKNLKLK